MRPTPRKLAEIAIFHGAVQKIAELAPLITLLQRRKLNTIVEIGTAKGGTFWLWCQLAQLNATIVSIDLPDGEFGGGYSSEDIEKFKTYGQEKQSLHFFRANSHHKNTVKMLRKVLMAKAIDLLFIDGDHRYTGVKQDFQFYSPLVKNRGLIAFHDILPHSQVKQCQVDRFWYEIKANYQNWEFTEPQDDRGWGQWGGIGVVRYT
jgi:predicted O-methyltransferase YrrM